uniref:Uncharacterized protein n=1 Tax=Caenorhabditis japonica TaxID=281687 RepID=A0A8R1EMU3_CAEJA
MENVFSKLTYQHLKEHNDNYDHLPEMRINGLTHSLKVCRRHCSGGQQPQDHPLLVIKKKKLGWAGHIMRRNDGRWTRLMQELIPRDEKQPIESPPMILSDSQR